MEDTVEKIPLVSFDSIIDLLADVHSSDQYPDEIRFICAKTINFLGEELIQHMAYNNAIIELSTELIIKITKLPRFFGRKKGYKEVYSILHILGNPELIREWYVKKHGEP